MRQMVTTNKGWVIGEYTGDPYKDKKITFGTGARAANYGTHTVDGAVSCAIAIGTTNTGSAGIRCTSTSSQLTAGSVIFAGDVATDDYHYFIISEGP